jgi:hypothetical protein
VKSFRNLPVDNDGKATRPVIVDYYGEAISNRMHLRISQRTRIVSTEMQEEILACLNPEPCCDKNSRLLAHLHLTADHGSH